MIGPLGRLGAAATLRQHCPQITQRPGILVSFHVSAVVFQQHFIRGVAVGVVLWLIFQFERCRDEIDPTKMKDGVAQYLRLPLARHFLFSTISFIIELSSHLQCHETRIHLFYMKYLYERHSNFHINLRSCLLSRMLVH